eukprot:SAG11_NODE_6145_length_1377_cov_1.983568_1_plen_79_part_00
MLYWKLAGNLPSSCLRHAYLGAGIPMEYRKAYVYEIDAYIIIAARPRAVHGVFTMTATTLQQREMFRFNKTRNNNPVL